MSLLSPPLTLPLVTLIICLVINPILAAKNIHTFHPQYVKHLAAMNNQPGAGMDYEENPERTSEREESELQMLLQRPQQARGRLGMGLAGGRAGQGWGGRASLGGG